MDIVTRREAEAYMANLPDCSLPAKGIPPDIISDVSARMAEYTGREDWGEQTERTEYFDGGSQFIYVDFWPVDSIASINDDTEHEWPTDSLIASSEYWNSQGDDGIIFLTYYRTVPGNQNVKVVYTGGYDGVGSIPANIKRAGNMQIAYEMNRRFPGTFTEQPGRFESAEFSEFEGMGLLAEVRILLQRWKRKVPFA